MSRDWCGRIETLIVEACARKGVTRDDVVPLYVALVVALFGQHGPAASVQKANAAIIERWSPAALGWIKAQAWKIIEAARVPKG